MLEMLNKLVLNSIKESFNEVTIELKCAENNEGDFTYPEIKLITNDIDPEQNYTLQFAFNQFPKASSGSLMLQFYHLEKVLKSYVLSGFVTNATNELISYGDLPLILGDQHQNVIAQKVISFSELGNIPSLSAVPFQIKFEEEDIIQYSNLIKEWFVTIGQVNEKNIKLKNLDIHPEWREMLGLRKIAQLNKILDTLPPIPMGKIQFVPIETMKQKDDSIIVTLLIRNGTAKEIRLKEVALLIKDKLAGDIAAGIFNVNGLSIRKQSVKPWNFRFNPENILSYDFTYENLIVEAKSTWE